MADKLSTEQIMAMSNQPGPQWYLDSKAEDAREHKMLLTEIGKTHEAMERQTKALNDHAASDLAQAGALRGELAGAKTELRAEMQAAETKISANISLLATKLTDNTATVNELKESLAAFIALSKVGRGAASFAKWVRSALIWVSPVLVGIMMIIGLFLWSIGAIPFPGH